LTKDDELNDFGYAHLKAGRFAEAEERFRAAIAVHMQWDDNIGTARTAVLSSIVGVVTALDAQGKAKESADFLEEQSTTVSCVIDLLRKELPVDRR
jgi:hypothetical protein